MKDSEKLILYNHLRDAQRSLLLAAEVCDRYPVTKRSIAELHQDVAKLITDENLHIAHTVAGKRERRAEREGD